jgi:hypothetical protein
MVSVVLRAQAQTSSPLNRPSAPRPADVVGLTLPIACSLGDSVMRTKLRASSHTLPARSVIWFGGRAHASKFFGWIHESWVTQREISPAAHGQFDHRRNKSKPEGIDQRLSICVPVVCLSVSRNRVGGGLFSTPPALSRARPTRAREKGLSGP